MLRRVGGEPPAPAVGRKQRQSRVREYPALPTGRELAAFESKPVEALDDIRELERKTRTENRRGKAYGVEGHVVLGEKLHVVHVIAALPPGAPVAFRRRLAPLDRRRDIGDGRLETDIEH